MRTLDGLLMDVIKSTRKPGGMSDEALDWGDTDEEAAENWDKEKEEEGTTKSSNLSLGDFYDWAQNTGFRRDKIDGTVFRQWATDVVGADPVEADTFWNENTSQNASLYREPNRNEAKVSPKDAALAKQRASGAYSERPRDLGNGMKTQPKTQVPHRDAAVQPSPVDPHEYKPGKDRAYSEVDSTPPTQKVTTYSGGTQMSKQEPVTNPKEIYPKDKTFKSLFEAQSWNNPDPSRFVIRPTTTGERREHGARMRFIIDEVPHKEPTGSFGNRIVRKGYRYSSDRNSGGGLAGAGGIDGKNYFDSHWSGPDDDDDSEDTTPKLGKGPKSGASQKRDDEGTEKSLTEFVRKSYLAREMLDSLDITDEQRAVAMEAIKNSDFWEEKINRRDDKAIANKKDSVAEKVNDKDKPAEEKASKRLRDAVISGEAMKANVRGKDGKSVPVTQASSGWAASGEKVSDTGAPAHQKADETPRIKPERLHKIQDAKASHDEEIKGRNSKAQAYLDSKKAAWRKESAVKSGADTYQARIGQNNVSGDKAEREYQYGEHMDELRREKKETAERKKKDPNYEPPEY